MTDESTVDEELEAFEKEQRLKRMKNVKEIEAEGGSLMVIVKAFASLVLIGVSLNMAVVALGGLAKGDLGASIMFFLVGVALPWYLVVRMWRKRGVKGKE